MSRTASSSSAVRRVVDARPARPGPRAGAEAGDRAPAGSARRRRGCRLRGDLGAALLARRVRASGVVRSGPGRGRAPLAARRSGRSGPPGWSRRPTALRDVCTAAVVTSRPKTASDHRRPATPAPPCRRGGVATRPAARRAADVRVVLVQRLLGDQRQQRQGHVAGGRRPLRGCLRHQLSTVPALRRRRAAGGPARRRGRRPTSTGRSPRSRTPSRRRSASVATTPVAVAEQQQREGVEQVERRGLAEEVHRAARCSRGCAGTAPGPTAAGRAAAARPPPTTG